MTSVATSHPFALPGSVGALAHIHEHRETNRADLKTLHTWVGASARVLDLGAGRGGFVREARQLGFHAWALDVEPGATDVWSQGRVPGVIANACSPPFAVGSFDAIRLKEIIEHVTDPRSLVDGAVRLLRDDGILLAHVPTPYSVLYPIANFWDDYTHVRPFTRVALHHLMEDCGMRVVEIEGYVSGRNGVERIVASVVGRLFPHVYRVLATRAPQPSAASGSDAE